MFCQFRQAFAIRRALPQLQIALPLSLVGWYLPYEFLRRAGARQRYSNIPSVYKLLTGSVRVGDTRPKPREYAQR
jgi:hypothetical protein